MPTLSNSAVQHGVHESPSGDVETRLRNTGSNIQPTCLSGERRIDVATRTGVPFDHHSLEKKVSEFISRKEDNVPVPNS